MIYNRKLTSVEIEKMKKYLVDRYIKGEGGVPEHTHDDVPKHTHESNESNFPSIEGLTNRYSTESFDGIFVDVGSNTGTGSVTKKSQEIDRVLAQNKDYVITTNMEINNNDRNWRSVFHYGNNAAERMPAMLIWPNDPWKMHFKLRTNRNHHDGIDFHLPGQFRKYNIPLEIKIIV